MLAVGFNVTYYVIIIKEIGTHITVELELCLNEQTQIVANEQLIYVNLHYHPFSLSNSMDSSVCYYCKLSLDFLPCFSIKATHNKFATINNTVMQYIHVISCCIMASQLLNFINIIIILCYIYAS